VSTSPASRPHGMALDQAHHRIFSAGANGKLVAIDTRTGAAASSVAITSKVDQIAFDVSGVSSTARARARCRLCVQVVTN